MVLNVLNLGLVPYETALQLQRTLMELRKANRVENTLLLLEHPPVITLGRNAQVSNVLASPEFLAQRGVELFDIDRGGDVTFHGPGQLVAYPIFDLRSFEPKLGAVEFVRRLEEVLIRTCGDFGIATQRIKGLTGVWTYALRNKPEAKIAALGVHISRGVTTHGFALNVGTDLDFFSLIVPCGLTDKPVTSMERELQKQVDVWKKWRQRCRATSGGCSTRRCCGWSRSTTCWRRPPGRRNLKRQDLQRTRTLRRGLRRSCASCTATVTSWRNVRHSPFAVHFG